MGRSHQPKCTNDAEVGKQPFSSANVGRIPPVATSLEPMSCFGFSSKSRVQ